MSNLYKLGIDIGSTTVKVALMNDNDDIIFSDYERHYANIQDTLANLLRKAREITGPISVHPVITGSGGLTLANHLEIPFNQEVVSVSTALRHYAPQTDVAIELGGEDAKIIYFTGGIDQRMNGICAGGTGSFIDQMASLLQTDAAGLNEYAKNYKAIYPIAARCGVFAKTDIQPLINEGATKEDLSASIFQAVVNQTISGLACGKPIRGHVAFLGGPLHFLSELKEAFIRTLHLTDEYIIAPDNSHLFAAIGSALAYKEDAEADIDALIERLSSNIKMDFEVERMEPLFADKKAYDDFIARHDKATVKKGDLATYKMPVQQQPRSPSLLRTELFFTRSTITITEALLPHPSGQLPTYIISFPRMYISSVPALPDMVKRLSNPHSCLMKARLRRFRIITPLPSSTRK